MTQSQLAISGMAVSFMFMAMKIKIARFDVKQVGCKINMTNKT